VFFYDLFVQFFLFVLQVSFKVALEVFYWGLHHMNDEDNITT
jgi:hypothetical protein